MPTCPSPVTRAIASSCRGDLSDRSRTAGAAPSVAHDQLGDRHARTKLPHQIIGIVLDANRVPGEGCGVNPGLALFGRGEVVDLQLDAITVGVSIIHRRRRTVVHAEEWTQPARLESGVRVEQVAHGPERERDVVEPRLLDGLDAELGAGRRITRREWTEIEK